MNSEHRHDDSPIRVVSLCQVDGAGGGADRIVLRSAIQAVESNVEMAVCCLRREDEPGFDFGERAKRYGISYQEVIERSKFDYRAFKKVRKIVRDHQADVVHAHSYKPSLFAYLLAQLDGIIPLSTSHGWSGTSLRERLFYYPLDRFVARRFPIAIAVSSQIRQQLIDTGCSPHRVRVLLNGVDPQEYRRDDDIRSQIRREFDIPTNQVVLGAVGRLEQQKRFDLLIDAFAILARQRTDLQLLIAGEGQLEPNLHRQLSRLGLERRCRLLGYRSDIFDVYHAFDILVQSSEYEGTPTVLVEAMALEIPIVATRSGGTEELVEHEKHGLLVPCHDTNALANAINRALKKSTRNRQSRGIR
jgi:glycosyltransferase involved in cell wall biosynthesis